MISESAQSILQKRLAQAEANRLAMPTVSAWVDELREYFPGARVMFAQEGGKALGKPLPKGVVPVLQTTAAPRARADDSPRSKHAAGRAATYPTKLFFKETK